MLRTEPRGIPPILVRLRYRSHQDPVFAEGAVHVEAEWGASEPTRWRTQATQGLCIIPWQHGRRVRLRFRHESANAEVELTAQQVREGAAAELWLG